MAIKTLIVDDSPFSRDLLRYYLERLGCQVVAQASDGAQALALFRLARPELVTLDLVMPAVDGIDALTVFRQIKKEDPQVPIAIVSAIPFEKTRSAFMAEGALDFVIKPFNKGALEVLRHKLRRIYPDVAREARP